MQGVPIHDRKHPSFSSAGGSDGDSQNELNLARLRIEKKYKSLLKKRFHGIAWNIEGEDDMSYEMASHLKHLLIYSRLSWLLNGKHGGDGLKSDAQPLSEHFGVIYVLW